MILFHFCEKFKENIKDKDCEESIYNKILENTLRTNLKNIGSISSFTGKMYVLKTSKPKTRTIIQEESISIGNESLNVYFVRDIVANKNFDYVYGKRIFPKLKNGEWIKKNPLSNDDVKKFISDYKKGKITKEDNRDYPTEEMVNWLNDFKLKLDNDIFETENWVKYALSSSVTEGMIDNYVHTFRLALSEITNTESLNSEIVKEQNEIKIIKYKFQNIGILFSEIKIDNNKVVYLLYNAAHLEKQKDYWNNALKEINENNITIQKNIESISRNAFRSYPKWTIKKDELWFAIQKSTELSNLSLTREQIIFFKTFKFPYYINGQAGSGKSTMLYYLFANSYYYKCSNEINGDIIFLTENETLLEQTKKSVFDLLTNNPEFNGLTVSQKNDSKKHFNSFKKFLINLLPENDKYLFKEKKYLNFSKFKQLYENSNIQKHIIEKYSAEISWFTIITYINGYNSDIKVTSKEYLDIIPNKSRIIPKHKFEGIEKNVLPFYEKLINEDNYWDKLKIIRFIENNVTIKKKYSVLLCDEAQDFCRVELRFILKLSKYLDYDLSKINQVPIVFAGDPNQTVNPTGFRQGEMTSMLYEELQEIAGFNYNKDENVYNPSFNYRSTQPVVSIANFVQYHRIKNLGIKQLNPQEAKRPNSNLDKDFNIFLNYKTINNEPNLKESLIKKLKYKIFIIPVNSQEKEDYIQKHNILSLIDEIEVKTAVEAKGAEYEQVVLFGFGEFFINNFERLTDNKSNKEDLFRRGFFFNKLYVGLTRAQTELIIIDSENSEELFWKKIVDNASISGDKWQVLNSFKEKTIEYNPGSINNIISSTPEDALKNAKKDKEQGLYDNNPARLKVAANQFFRIGKKEDGYDCLAISEQIKGNYLRAAEFYLNEIFNIPKYEEAANCLFQGRHFNELIRLIGNNLKTVEQDIRIVISRIIDGKKLMKQDIDILFKNKEKFVEIIKDLDWRDEFIDNLILNSYTIQILEHKKDFVKILEFIANSNDIELWKEIGNIRYDLKHYKEAIEAWSEIDLYDEKYCISKIQLAKEENDDENVVLWLASLVQFKTQNEQTSLYKEIIDNYLKNENTSFSEDYYLPVFKAFVFVKNESELFIEINRKIEDTINCNKLTTFYEGLLKDEGLTTIISNYLIERWAKCIWKSNQNVKEINDRYFKLSQNRKLIYNKFTVDELNSITELPERINWYPSKHIAKIEIQNFRRFGKISLSDVGQYNLIVGDNNVGKTSLLEALLFTTNKEQYYKNLLFAYISRINISKSIINNEEKYILQLNEVFNSFIKNDSISKELNFKLEEGRNLWNYTIRNAKRNEIEIKYKHSTNIDTDEYLSFIIKGKENEIIELPLILKKILPKDLIKSPLIPFGKGFSKDLALSYYENIDKIKSERNSFVESLRIFIPNIERINVNTEKGEIDIEEANCDISAPLHQYGEGANKLFRILVQITLQKNEKLLIDEIDAGIHYSHFSEFWKTILKVANKNNVQIFATTHNIECVNHFSDILTEDDFKSYQDKSRILTLRELPDNSIKAYTRMFDEFKYELENDFEIRGGDL